VYKLLLEIIIGSPQGQSIQLIAVHNNVDLILKMSICNQNEGLCRAEALEDNSLAWLGIERQSRSLLSNKVRVSAGIEYMNV
jgi:hypothetical protein